jgi:hypothetical protein
VLSKKRGRSGGAEIPTRKKETKTFSHKKREKNRNNQNKKLFYNFKEKKRKSQKIFFLTFLHNKVFQEKEIQILILNKLHSTILSNRR